VDGRSHFSLARGNLGANGTDREGFASNVIFGSICLGWSLDHIFYDCQFDLALAAYRPDLHPEILRMSNDCGWLIFVMAYPEYIVQLGCIAAVGFMDKRPKPFLPRWVCYATLGIALTGTGGGFATFFKTGPFAWNGVIGSGYQSYFSLAGCSGSCCHSCCGQSNSKPMRKQC